jgi:uncharacterized protein YbjT (DUF2867 family)
MKKLKNKTNIILNGIGAKMNTTPLHAVTGAFGYSGKYITQALLNSGQQVITLTNNPNRQDPFNGQVVPYPFNFLNPNLLAETLQGVDTLYNTYWVRFDHGNTTFSKAVENTKTLIRAAKDTGVRKFVHVSISNPTIHSNLPYFKGKAELEEYLRDSGISYAILRPTVIFGREDILINNIAWLLRHFPVFAIPGHGGYRLQPIYVEDMANLAIQAGQMDSNLIWDAVGPETYTFNELAHTIAEVIGKRPWVVHVPPGIALVLTKLISLFIGDVMLTGDEITGLMDDLLVSKEPPRGKKSLKDWLEENKEIIGLHYASELARHYHF